TPGTYKVKVTPNPSYPVASSTAGTDNGTDGNNDGTQAGAQGTASTSFAFTLGAGTEPGTTGSTNVENTIDFGFRGCPTIGITPTSLAAGVVATVYTQATAFSASNGTAPYVWSVSGLPAGMSWDSTNLKLIGTPLFTGTSSLLLSVTDAKGCVGSLTVPFQICSTPVLKPDTMPAATVGAVYSTTLSATEPGFDLQQAFSSTQIGTLANADAVLAGTNRTSNWTGSGAVVNFVGSGGGDGNFTGTVFPGGDGDDFAVRATGIITIPTAGAWSFGINSDDGCRVKVDGTTVFTDDTQHAAGDHFGTVTLTAGTHTIDAVFFERAGGESFELFAASGTKSAFSTSFKLIGSSGGVAVARATTAFTYALASGALPNGLSLNTSTGVVSGTPTVAGTYNFTISATDSVGCVGTKSYTMTAACPTLTMTPAAGLLNTGTVGSAYSQALSSSGSFGTLVWSISSGTLPAGLAINSTTGAITGTPTSVTSGTSGTSLSITAQDQYGCTVTQAYTLKICPVLGFSPSTLATPVVGTAYSQTITAGNGTGPYTFTVSSGTPPTGLSLGTSGVLSGTPTSTTSKTFTVQATDANGCPGTISYTLTPVCPAVTLSPSTVAVGTVSSVYSQSLSASGGTAPYTWSLQSGTLPAGLSLASSTGVISGTPTVTNGSGTPLTFKAIGLYGCSGVISYTLKICPVITVSPAALPNGTVGTAYSTTITQSGGASPVTFAVTSGTLPAGLSLSSSTGVISGTPTASTGAGASFTVTATDANSCTGSVTTTLKICPVLAIGPASLPVPTVGTAYSQTVTASNGASPYTYSVSTGSLPTGLTLSSAGVLSGTVTNTTSQSFTVQATDANGCPGTISYTVAAVCPTLTFTPSTLSSGTEGVVYSQTLTASAGTAPYTWVVSSGTLPSGVTLSSAGVLSGTPTATNGAGVAITFRATDTYGCTNTVGYTFKICPVITMSPGTLAGATVGTVYSQTITASGGATPYAYSRSSGTLPSGLSLSSAGVLSGTATSSTSRTFTIQALDANSCAGSLSYTLAPVCPTISITPATIASGTVGIAYSQALSASGGNLSYTWSLQSGTLPAGLSLASATGVISGTPTASNGAGTSLTLKATDIYGCSATQVYTLKICPVLALGPSPLPRGTVGSSYSSAITASGGATPYSFAISSGTLPAGLTFTGSTGQISGTPTASNGSGTVITFSATDANNCPGSFNITLQICPVIAMAPATFNTPVIGTPFSQSVTASNGAAPYVYSVTSGTLPAGMSLSSAGVLSGTATSTTAQTFVVTAVDANGCPAVRTYTITPVCPSITLAPATIPYGTVGSLYSQTLTATGGNAPYSWSLQAGSLPAGLSLSTGGVISGTPAVSNGAGISLTFAATDVYGCVVTVTYNLKICPIITLSPSVLPYGTVGVSYSSSVTQSGGAAPATFAITGGTLPAGLSFAGSTGVISGTPAASNGAGVTVTFTATDANGCPGSIDSLFKICPVIAISPTTASTPVVGFA
ncbi:MAG: hypothetical protein JWO08_4745, partial [Verrucomicrobiaceae bacterium]|nr:hypothetical protein [Verrucomicrobiaceae bacterium]